MSLLSQFFEGRHKDDNKKQKNQTIVAMFNSSFQTPKIVSSIPNKNSRKTITKIQNKANQQQIQSQNQRKQQANEAKIFQNRKKIQKTQKTKKIQKEVMQNTKQRKRQSKNTNISIQQSSNKKNEKQENLNINQQQKEQQKQNLDSTVFVGNIPLSSTHKSIKKYFQKYGKILKVWFRSIPVQQSKIPKKGLHILKKYQQGADSMNGYVKFQKQEEAKDACKSNGEQIEGHNIKVTMCKQFQIDYQTTVFIGNLPKNIKDQQLWENFKSIGPIKSVRVIRNKQTLEGIGIGYVRFENKEDMRKAISQMNGKKIGDRPMRIKKAVSKQRIQKKVKKIKEKKQNKGKTKKFEQPKLQKTGKGINIVQNKNNAQKAMPNIKIGKFKHKPINKNFINDKYTNNQRHPKNYTPLIKSDQVVRTKFGFKGTKKQLQ